MNYRIIIKPNTGWQNFTKFPKQVDGRLLDGQGEGGYRLEWYDLTFFIKAVHYDYGKFKIYEAQCYRLNYVPQIHMLKS